MLTIERAYGLIVLSKMKLSYDGMCTNCQSTVSAIMPTAATTGDGLYEALDWLVATLQKQRVPASVNSSHNTKSVTSQNLSHDTSDPTGFLLVYKAWHVLKNMFTT